LPRAPKWQGNFTLTYSTPVGAGDFYAMTDWDYRSSYNMFLYEAREYKAKPLVQGGLRAGYKWGDGKYELAAYARNITNRIQVVAAIDFDNLTGILNEPRTFGAAVQGELLSSRTASRSRARRSLAVADGSGLQACRPVAVKAATLSTPLA
jgi:hypothetical protein